MAIIISQDIERGAFLGNPINVQIISDRNIDFSHQISAIIDNGGKVRLDVNLITQSGQNLTVGDVIRLDGFVAADNLYLNGLYTTVTAITGTYLIDTTIDYVTSAAIVGVSQLYYRENKNFEIRYTVSIKFGTGGTYVDIAGPTSKSIDGINFYYDVSKYLKLLYSQNVGSNETPSIIIPVVFPNNTFEYELPIGKIDFQEYFDDVNGLQTTGDSLTSSSNYLHDGTKYPNDLINKSEIFIDGSIPGMIGRGLNRITKGLSKKYFYISFVTFKSTFSGAIFYYNSSGVVIANQGFNTISANIKWIVVSISSNITNDVAYAKFEIFENSSPFTRFWTEYFYFSESFCPGYLVKYKNDLGGHEILNCGLVQRSLDVSKSSWEKKLDFPFTTTDFGPKNIIQRSDDILELETNTILDWSQAVSLFETESVIVYDIENAREMHGSIITDKSLIDTNDSENLVFKVQLNRRK